MIFDLKSGKRRRVVQVVFGFLAAVFFISFVGFGIGSDASRRDLRRARDRRRHSSSDDPQFEQQIEDAQSAVDANPKSGNANADLIGALLRVGVLDGVQTDQQTGQVSITEDARNELYRRPQAWDDYFKTKPTSRASTRPRTPSRSSSCSTRPAAPRRRSGSSPTSRSRAAAFGQLAFYLYADLKIHEGR